MRMDAHGMFEGGNHQTGMDREYGHVIGAAQNYSFFVFLGD